MADINDFPNIPGYVSIKQAAEMLGITDKRVYRYIDLGRLPAFKSGGVFLLAEEEIKRFKLHPPGRSRTAPPAWRVYNNRSHVFATSIQIHVRDGQQSHLLERLQTLQKEGHHTFPGTVARYVTKGDPELTWVHFFFVWKDSDMPDEPTRQQQLIQFQHDFSDVLDWETAEYGTNEIILHT